MNIIPRDKSVKFSFYKKIIIIILEFGVHIEN